ncbi:rho GTPase-activating protein 36-like [Sitophilus oryzae]|uniref:Rho GTPase-activating protein 36-like n=1 Tax=Sitophilus oryzae TaxID=7048 RepID=A0A6J2XMF4_SITOR|nr:rho GTPase-activating protein 36-like [Sitophilus oryzae]
MAVTHENVDAAREELPGNKMDTNNLATVFAPNILHCIKPGGKDMSDRSEDRIDVINVVRTLIDHYKQLFLVPAELLDEIYVHMMDSHPEALDQLLNKKDAIAGADDKKHYFFVYQWMNYSECNSAPWTPTQPNSEVSMENAFDPKYIQSEPKKTYSREECLHEAAATGGPNVGMRIRHKDKIRERSLRRKRENTKTVYFCPEPEAPRTMTSMPNTVPRPLKVPVPRTPMTWPEF